MCFSIHKSFSLICQSRDNRFGGDEKLLELVVHYLKNNVKIPMLFLDLSQ